MSQIDIHMLVLGNERADWLEQAVRSVPTDLCKLHVVDGVPGHIGQARVRAYQLGNAPLVGFIDPDDWFAPGAVEQCLEFLRHRPRCAGVATWEIVIDYFARRCYPARGKHGLKLYRRDWIARHYEEMASDPAQSTDIRIAMKPEIVELPLIGRYWRKYPSEAFRIRKRLGLHARMPDEVDLSDDWLPDEITC
ncbi:hypothetical protein A7A76_06095 [Lysobacter enzymogenes]|uniref:glycosyltransferase family A protein n=1 Tax=Lysobacter enzymogenes TaxID=69 RepID=UPI0019D0EAEB|nr:glycosyltransferase family A protein [Lysobacter enzymogenes]MBN7138680.1 hypothetical protein [Lysobacter enzymogenes]